ncbi:LysR family transcriptional regulator [Enterococcus hermanniensis]|uniref:HTH lysR-type domain-containing protein n=1 Tax=Enterococcus hermanniensis TaxID=249189 RepID=A0A1L8TQG8_9ENTE|nr:LysR family transcriptional regulator [Enterococcus hermanniensis]OJG46561.1 hypothetical protein RV04_GL000989 [Enterococcus hermanniensis]
MSIEKLEYFYMIARYNSISKASTELYISISSLSSALKSLENELGYALFIRNGKKLVLSEDGERILPCVKRIIEEANKINIPLYQKIAQPSIKVGVSDSALIFEADRHHCLDETFNLQFINAAPLELLTQLKEKQIDLVITNCLVEDPALERSSLIQLTPLVAMHSSFLHHGKEISPVSLEKLPFIVLTDHIGHHILTKRVVEYLDIKPDYLFCHDSLGINKWLNEKKGVFIIRSIEKDLFLNKEIKFISLSKALGIDYYLYKNKSNSQMLKIDESERYLKNLFTKKGNK